MRLGLSSQSSIVPIATALISGFVLLLGGCGSSVPSLKDLNDTNMRKLHSAYKIYMQRNELKGPADKDELVEFLTTNRTAKALLSRMGVEVDAIEDIFVSDRDGQPFKIRWGVEGIADHAIVFEAEGVGGKRMVAFTRTRELDDQEYEGYWSCELEGQKPGGRMDSENQGPAN